MNTSTMKIARLNQGELDQYTRSDFPLVEQLSENDKQKLRSERTTLIITGVLTVLIVGIIAAVDPEGLNLSRESQRYLILCILTAAAVASIPLTGRYIKFRKDLEEGVKHVGIARVIRRFVQVNDESADDCYLELQWKSDQKRDVFQIRSDKMYEQLENGNMVYLEIRAVSKTLISFTKISNR